MERKNRSIVNPGVLLLAICNVFLLFLYVSACPQSRRLVIWNEAQERERLNLPVKVGDYLTLQYKHSYEKDETWDLYRIESDRFRQVGTAFTFFSYDARNSTYEKGFSLEAGTAKIVDMDKNYDVAFRTLEPRVGFTVRQWVVLNGNVYQLQAFGNAGEKLVFSIQR